MNKNKIKVEGHRGTWYVVDELVKFGQLYYLLEHNTYGEEANWVAINEAGELVMEDITDGATELAEYLEDKYMCNMCGNPSANLIKRRDGDQYCKDCHESNCEHIKTETVEIPGTDETYCFCHDCGEGL
jgi:hypothetical protein